MGHCPGDRAGVADVARDKFHVRRAVVRVHQIKHPHRLARRAQVIP